MQRAKQCHSVKLSKLSCSVLSSVNRKALKTFRQRAKQYQSAETSKLSGLLNMSGHGKPANSPQKRKFCPSHRTRPTHVASTAATNIGGFWQRLAAEGVLNARGRLSELLRRRGRATISRRHRRPWRRAHTRRRNGTLPSLPSCLERGSLRRENRTKRKTET